MNLINNKNILTDNLNTQIWFSYEPKKVLLNLLGQKKKIYCLVCDL